MYRLPLYTLAFALFAGAAHAETPPAAHRASLDLTDQQRARSVPVELYFPARADECSATRRCPVAILGAGYGIGHREYTFVTDLLTAQGYLVASVNHQLPTDARMDPNGDMVRQRAVLAKLGAENIRFALGALRAGHPAYDWDRVVLVGHSMGGDSSALVAREDPESVAALVTLDSRRSVLPRTPSTRVLSIRASDTEADPGVLPTLDEQKQFGACIVKIPGARHNDMYDGGSPELKGKMTALIRRFLERGADGKPRFECSPESSAG